MLALVAIASLALVACGSSDKDNYKKDVQKITDPVESQLNDLNTKLSSAQTPADKADVITQAQGVLNDAAKKLGDLDPPSDVKSEHDKYVAAVQKFSDDLGPIADALKAGDATKAQQEFATLQADVTQLKSAQDALEKKVSS
jgi:hypothetical protein